MMKHSKSAIIRRTIGTILLVFYTLAIHPSLLLQLHWSLPVKGTTAAVQSADNSSKEDSKRTIVSEACDVEAIMSSGVQCIIPKWHLQTPLFFMLFAGHNLPVVKLLHQIALLAYLEVLFETLILPNAP